MYDLVYDSKIHGKIIHNIHGRPWVAERPGNVASAGALVCPARDHGSAPLGDVVD